MAPSEAAAHALDLARRKADEVSGRIRAGQVPGDGDASGPAGGDSGGGRTLVIAADTLVVLPDRVLGKPTCDAEAELMLAALQGRDHHVVTAVVVTDSQTGETRGATEETKVFFRPLDREAIKAYVSTGEPSDKAGAYAVQGVGSLLVERIEGDYFNVVGLPLGCLAKLLKSFDQDLLLEAAGRPAAGAPDGKATEPAK